MHATKLCILIVSIPSDLYTKIKLFVWLSPFVFNLELTCFFLQIMTKQSMIQRARFRPLVTMENTLTMLTTT